MSGSLRTLRALFAWPLGVTNGLRAILEAHAPGSECRPLDDLGSADPIHAEMAKALSCRVPGNKVPKRRQDQHGLRLDGPLSQCSFRVSIPESQTQPLKKRALKCWQQGAVHLAQVRNINLRREPPDVQAVQKATHIAELVWRKRLLYFGKPGIGEAEERQRAGGAHT